MLVQPELELPEEPPEEEVLEEELDEEEDPEEEELLELEVPQTLAAVPEERQIISTPLKSFRPE